MNTFENHDLRDLAIDIQTMSRELSELLQIVITSDNHFAHRSLVYNMQYRKSDTRAEYHPRFNTRCLPHRRAATYPTVGYNLYKLCFHISSVVKMQKKKRERGDSYDLACKSHGKFASARRAAPKGEKRALRAAPFVSANATGSLRRVFTRAPTL